VRIEGESLLDAKVIHQHERDAVGKGEALVGPAFQASKTGFEEAFVDVHDTDGGTCPEVLGDIHGLAVPAAARKNVTSSEARSWWSRAAVDPA
jgi:hypothetical protein